MLSGDTSGANTTWVIIASGNTTSKTAEIYLARAGNGNTGYNVMLNHFAVGKWK